MTVPCILANHSGEEPTNLLKSPVFDDSQWSQSEHGETRLISDQRISTSYTYHSKAVDYDKKIFVLIFATGGKSNLDNRVQI